MDFICTRSFPKCFCKHSDLFCNVVRPPKLRPICSFWNTLVKHVYLHEIKGLKTKEDKVVPNLYILLQPHALQSSKRNNALDCQANIQVQIQTEYIYHNHDKLIFTFPDVFMHSFPTTPRHEGCKNVPMERTDYQPCRPLCVDHNARVSQPLWRGIIICNSLSETPKFSPLETRSKFIISSWVNTIVTVIHTAPSDVGLSCYGLWESTFSSYISPPIVLSQRV